MRRRRTQAPACGFETDDTQWGTLVHESRRSRGRHTARRHGQRRQPAAPRAGTDRRRLRLIEEGRDCADIVTQLAAVSRALDRAGFAIISTGLKQCLIDSGGVDNLDSAQMEKLFLSLA